MSIERIAIIVAGGTGQRMGASTPKQFLPLGGEPVLMRTLRAFACIEPAIRLVLVLPAAHEEQWQKLCAQHNFSTPHTVVHGGAERFHSVRNGLQHVPNSPNALVAVHDAVRPLIEPKLIATAYDMAQRHGAAVPVVPPVDSVRVLLDNGHTQAVERNRVLLVQTPQTFRADLLLSAYAQPYSPHFTDDASVVEAAGIGITTFAGQTSNIKLTTPHDMAVAEYLIKHSM